METSKLLSLPAELLVYICNFLEIREGSDGPQTTSNVRCSCKTLRDAVFGRWSDTLLRRRTLRIVDEKLVADKYMGNLRHLVAVEAFARRIQVVTLCLEDARSVNHPLLVGTLADLKQASIEVAVVLQGDDGKILYQNLNHFLLYAVLSTGCKVAKVRMEGCPNIDPRRLELFGEMSGSFKDLAKELKEIEYIPYVEEERDLDTALVRHRSRLILLREAHKLEKLSLRQSDPDFGNEAFASEFLLANQYSCLREVSLDQLYVRTSDIITLLQRTKTTLESFRFEGRLHSHHQPQWFDMLRQLHQCDRMRRLKIGPFHDEDEQIEIIHGNKSAILCELSTLEDVDLPPGLLISRDEKDIITYAGEGIHDILALTIKDYKPKWISLDEFHWGGD